MEEIEYRVDKRKDGRIEGLIRIRSTDDSYTSAEYLKAGQWVDFSERFFWDLMGEIGEDISEEEAARLAGLLGGSLEDDEG